MSPNRFGKKKFKAGIPIDLGEMRPKGFHESIRNNLSEINARISGMSGWVGVDLCPICGTKYRSTWIFAYENQIVQCDKCSHKYAARRPKIPSEAYDNEMHQSNAINTYDAQRDYRISRFAVERVQIIQKYISNGDLLDYGCGTGWFLEYAKNYFSVTGFEPTKELASFTSKLLDIAVLETTRELKKDSFDVITAFDVIEHVADPVEIISLWRDILKPGGIVLLYTPNSSSIGFQHLKEENNLVIPPLHLHYFNKKSLEMLIANNFELMFFETAGLDIGDIYAFERDSGDNDFCEFLKSNAGILQTFFDHIDYSNSLRAVIKKSD